jgi:Na+-transporting methylmalonyl-CoA/oxaloacetate decarboxylase beta subunit
MLMLTMIENLMRCCEICGRISGGRVEMCRQCQVKVVLTLTVGPAGHASSEASAAKRDLLLVPSSLHCLNVGVCALAHTYLILSYLIYISSYLIHISSYLYLIRSYLFVHSDNSR